MNHFTPDQFVELTKHFIEVLKLTDNIPADGIITHRINGEPIPNWVDVDYNFQKPHPDSTYGTAQSFLIEERCNGFFFLGSNDPNKILVAVNNMGIYFSWSMTKK
jgi:hypothetical protein